MREPLEHLKRMSAFKALLDKLASRRARAGGLTPAAASLLSVALAQTTGRETLLVVPHIDEAENLHENAQLFLEHCALLEAPEAATSFQKSATSPATRSRVRLFRQYLPGARRPRLVVASAAALMEAAPGREDLSRALLVVRVGGSLKMHDLADWLLSRGFHREYGADAAMIFAIRGGILDVWPPGEDLPVRIEFFGDEVASIRTVNPVTARSVKELRETSIVAPGGAATSAGAPFTSLLDETAIAVVWEAGDVQRAAQAHRTTTPGPRAPSWEELWKELERFSLIEASQFEFAGADALSFHTRAFSIAARDVEGIVEEFADFAVDIKRTLVFSANAAEKARLEELFAQHPARNRLFSSRIGRFNHSFYFADRSLALVGHQDIFHRYRQRRRLKAQAPSRPIASLVELNSGDYVVHADHGIARYTGTEVVEKDRTRREYLVLVFAGGTRLLVPVTHIDLVSRYIGPSDRPPKLSAIGSKVWKARKAQVARAVRELAGELLRLQAVRESKAGMTSDFDTHIQGQFEAEFAYEETDDQITTMDEIREDMSNSRPMDRLLCGDVGFGKTELAIRAAFAAVTAGRQVAILVPTTILAEQHFRTFSERMADYPILLDVLSRMRSKKAQRKTLENLRRKTIDILIGTHRLIQRDVVFADLGLVVIDEEQRFGVAAKERLKRLRATVDVLTLTATPIPRTLHMALVGLRDISVLETPPEGRQAVSTFVGRLDDEELREVILREINREGQVFFVHNRVHSIDEVAAHLARIVPEARIAVAHGQMREGLLASRMMDFIEGACDVLVATTIIESGLDIPNANTIIVDQADMYGLADLHQLRGRVGRYKRRAYAYFLLPDARPVSPEGAKRLQAIEHFSDLGSGFRIALRDMELRGVGNVLGREQSGHIALVGYELFCRLLNEAVAHVKGTPGARIPECYIELGTSSFIPASYVESPAYRLDLYKRLSAAVSTDAIDSLEREMTDRFGPLVLEAEEFLQAARLRVLAFAVGISTILLRRGELLIQASPIESAADALRRPHWTVRIADGREALVVFDRGAPSGSQLLQELVNILRPQTSSVRSRRNRRSLAAPTGSKGRSPLPK